MNFKNYIMIYRIILLSLSILIFSIGCKKDVEDDQSNENGKEIDFDINYGSISDIDGNNYNTIVIGSQEWMAENLKVTRYNNGDSVAGLLTDNEWSATSDPAYSFWNSDTAMLEAYGIFYNGYTFDDSRNICPSGWSVPSQYDWTKLSDYLINTYDVINSKNVGNYLKSCRQQGSPLGGDCDVQEDPAWNGHNEHYGTNDFGFSVMPSGIREANGSYAALGYLATFWTTDIITNNESIGFGLSYDSGKLEMGSGVFNTGFCIRCIKN